MINAIIKSLFFALMLQPLALFSQTPEGGGAYIANNGVLENSIVTDNYAANGFGVAGTAGEVRNCNVISNKYSNYNLISVGDLLMDDGSLYTPVYDASGKIVFSDGYTINNVVGICVWKNSCNSYMKGYIWVMALTEIDMAWCPNGMYENAGWNPPDVEGLYNFGDPDLALLDCDGYTDTRIILNSKYFVYSSDGSSEVLTTSNCAAKYCYEYRHVAGTESSWFLPSVGQCREVSKQLVQLNKILTGLGKTTISGVYWTSNETSRQEAWTITYPFTSKPASANKKVNYKVRPMSQFAVEK